MNIRRKRELFVENITVIGQALIFVNKWCNLCHAKHRINHRNLKCKKLQVIMTSNLEGWRNHVFEALYENIPLWLAAAERKVKEKMKSCKNNIDEHWKNVVVTRARFPLDTPIFWLTQPKSALNGFMVSGMSNVFEKRISHKLTTKWTGVRPLRAPQSEGWVAL